MREQQRQSKWLIAVILLAAVVVTGIIISGNKGKRRAVAGIKDPVQTETTGQRELYIAGYDLTVKYLYEYDISALVVSTHNYRGSDVGDKLAPKDLALAWGPVAEYNDVSDFHW